jgi:hypothetical protein
MEEGRSDGYQRVPTGPRSFRSDEAGDTQEYSLEMNRLLDHTVSNMGRPVSRISGRQSDRESDIDLNESAEIARIVALRLVSQNQGGSFPNGLTQTSSVDNFITRCITCGRRHHTNQVNVCSPRSLSPESLEVHLPSSASAESGRLLHG